MQQINQAHIDALLETVNETPFFKLISMRVCELGVGYAKIQMPMEQKHSNYFGIMHGGVYASVIDSATYWSVYCQLAEEIGATTIDLSVNSLSSMKQGIVTAEGRSIKVGRSICLAEATVRDDTGRLLAHGTSKLMVLSGRQSVPIAIRAMGHTQLPPKFLD